MACQGATKRLVQITPWIYNKTNSTSPWSAASFHPNSAILSESKVLLHLAPNLLLRVLKRRAIVSSRNKMCSRILTKFSRWLSNQITTSFNNQPTAKMVIWWACELSKAIRSIWKDKLRRSTRKFKIKKRRWSGPVVETYGHTSWRSRTVPSWGAWSVADWSSTRRRRHLSSEVMDLIRVGRDLLRKIAKANSCWIKLQS